MNLPDLGEIAQSVVAVVLVFNSWQVWKTSHATRKISDDITAVKEATNGLTAKLLKVTATAARAEGKAEGIAETETTEK